MQRNLLEPPVKSHPICLPGAVEHILPTWLRLERPGEKSIEKFGWCAIVRFLRKLKCDVSMDFGVASCWPNARTYIMFASVPLPWDEAFVS